MLRFLTAVLLFSVGIAAFAQVRDFDMQTADGNAFSLDSIRTPLTLLYFQDPDGDMCHAVTDSFGKAPSTGFPENGPTSSTARSALSTSMPIPHLRHSISPDPKGMRC